MFEEVGEGDDGSDGSEDYELGDSLLGPSDVAILLQAGLTSPLKSSTVVQLNQRMLIDLIASQPNSFAVAVLAEIGSPGGQGSPRVLAGALMALLEMNQESFSDAHKLDMVELLEDWLGLVIPRRDHYMAGGRWARQSYYDAIYRVAHNILEDAEPYLALKGHLQRMREHENSDPIPTSPLDTAEGIASSPSVAGGGLDRAPSSISSSKKGNSSISPALEGAGGGLDRAPSKKGSSSISPALEGAASKARQLIEEADKLGRLWFSERRSKGSSANKDAAVSAYRLAFAACADVVAMDKLAFQVPWLKEFWRRNYDALQLLSVYGNVEDRVDEVRKWLDAMKARVDHEAKVVEEEAALDAGGAVGGAGVVSPKRPRKASSVAIDLEPSTFFRDAEKRDEFEKIRVIIDLMFYDAGEKKAMLEDPLVFLLIPNEEGQYNFTLITAMGVITEGKKGTEMEEAFKRLKAKRGVETVRADTGTLRNFEYNALKIEEAIKFAVENIKKPFGYVGYSQGCANAMTCESLMLCGTPAQRKLISHLACRQLLFSACNGSAHGSCSDAKAQKLIVMGEDAFKYHQGYFSKGFITFVLGALNSAMDSAASLKALGGAASMLPSGCRAFWREAQHKADVPTCVMRAVLERHTTPEALEMLSASLSRQTGSELHDSQVHVHDAVGHPVYTKNRNGTILERCDMGGSVQRTHHWSPLYKEVEFVSTKRDDEAMSFHCAKDRHIFPFVDVNARFGVIKYAK